MTKKSQTISPETLKLEVQVPPPSLSMRSHLSIRYLHAASMFTRRCWHLESNNIKSGIEENSYYAMAAIKFSYSAIEANINEFYQNLVDNVIFPDIEHQIGLEKIHTLSRVWNYIKRRNTLDKYETVMIFTDNVTYSQEGKATKEIYDKAKDLEKLRDALIHYKPEDSLKQNIHKTIEKSLSKYKIPISMYHNKSNLPYFPDKCLGHGLSEWSLITSIDFINRFYLKLGVTRIANIYERRSYPTR